MNKEKPKLPREDVSRYLEKHNYLFIIWADGNAYPKQVNELADRLKKRLQLNNIR